MSRFKTPAAQALQLLKQCCCCCYCYCRAVVVDDDDDNDDDDDDDDEDGDDDDDDDVNNGGGRLEEGTQTSLAVSVLHFKHLMLSFPPHLLTQCTIDQS